MKIRLTENSATTHLSRLCITGFKHLYDTFPAIIIILLGTVCTYLYLRKYPLLPFHSIWLPSCRACQPSILRRSSYVQSTPTAEMPHRVSVSCIFVMRYGYALLAETVLASQPPQMLSNTAIWSRHAQSKVIKFLVTAPRKFFHNNKNLRTEDE